MTSTSDLCDRCDKSSSPLIETAMDSDVWVCLACAQPHEMAIYWEFIDKIMLGPTDPRA